MPGNDSVGKIAIDVVGNEKPLVRQVEGLGKTLQKPMAKLGASMAAAFSAAAVLKFAKESTEAAAQVNAANSQMAQTFGEFEGTARSVMKNIAKDSGIMETRLQGVGTSIFAFAKTSGMDSASAMNLMQDALQATADSAAYYDRSLEETAESLKSFLKGNYANDAALGISCTETTRNAAANKLYGKSFKDLSEAQKQLTLLQMVKDANALSGAMGQAAREAEGWENVTGNLKEAWRQLQATIGQPMLKVATAGVKRLTAALQTLTLYAKSAVQEMSKLFGWDLSGISSATQTAADNMGGVAANADDGTDSIKATTKAAEKLKKTVAGFDQLNILSSGSGSTGGEEGGSPEEGAALSMPEPDVSGTEKAVDGIGKKLDKLKAKLKGLYKTGGLQKAVRNFQKQVDKINIDKIKSNFQSIFTSLEPIAKAGFDGVAKIAKSKLAFIGTLYGGLTRTAANALQTASGGIAKWLDEDKEKIAGYISSISDHISSGIDNCSEFASTMLDTFNESVERMRPETEKAIAEILSGFTTFGGSVGEVISEGFEIATEVAAQWAEDNKELIGTAFDNAQKIVNDCMSGIGKVFKDVGNDIASWWRSGGASVWKGFCKIVGDLGTIALRTFNEKIMPAWKSLTSTLKKGWDGCIRPILKRASSSLTKLWKQIIQPLWDNVLKPIISQIVDKEGKRLLRFVNQAGKTCSTVFDNIKSYVTKIFDALDHLIDFVTDVFKGDWESAWKDIKAFGKDAFEALVTSAKGQFNLLIDAVNSVWSGIYSFFADFVNNMSGTVKEIGKAVGQDWDISVPAEPTYIPHLAKGGLVKAPTLAMVGDNKGASHDPEVISPLSKLESMIKNRDPEIVRLLAKIAGLLERDENIYQNNIYLDGEVIERRLVKVRRRKQRRYGGATV